MHWYRQLAPPAFVIVWSIAGITMNCQAQTETNYDESKVPDYELPPLLVSNDGSPVTSAEQWTSSRRNEILRLFESSVYGKTPDRKLESIRYELLEESDQAFGGLATRQQIRIHIGQEDGPDLNLLLYIPNTDKPGDRHPCFFGLNFSGNQSVAADPAILMPNGWIRDNSAHGIVDNRATEKSRGAAAPRWPIKMIVSRGYALATMYYGDIDPDNYRHDFSDGIHPLFYSAGQTAPAPDEWGSIGAWAWGLSRGLDYLETNSRIDAKKVCVMGHSRLGKTALWAGAQDLRFAIVISNNSGCGGAALFRRCFGEQIHHMVKPIGYWFCKNHHAFAGRESELPVDQHMLIALMAPRPVYVASATEDRWADPKGEFLAAKHASPAYQLFGFQTLSKTQMPAPNEPVHTRIGYHVRNGKHDVTRFDWKQNLDFATKHLFENAADR